MYRRIIVPIDGSATAARGLREAIDVAKATDARLRLIHVVDELSASMAFGEAVTYSAELMQDLKNLGRDILREAVELAASQGIAADTVLADTLNGRLADLVVAEVDAWSADLIVLGTHGRRGIGRLVLGSDAEAIVRLATVPVLLVRAR